MRFAVFSDLHANLEATEAVLADAHAKDCTHYVCLGDLVGYNANPHECVEIVQNLDCPVVKGNHDEQACLNESSRGFNELAEQAITWTRENLTAADKEWLSELRLIRQVRDFTIVHATLDTPNEWGYVFNNLDAVASFTYQHTTVCFFGHTHVAGAFVRDDGVKRVRTEQRAAYCIYDTDKNVVEQRRVRYDMPKTQRKIIDAGLPRLLADRLELGR
jgi:predicted phosphodiesterase